MQMLAQQVLVGHVLRHLAHAVHVVGEAQKPRLHFAAGERLERAPDHARARDFAERSDVRQPGGSVAGLKQHRAVEAARQSLDALQNAARLLEGPGAGVVDGGKLFGRGVKRHENGVR
jgi:hypothetical protein